VVGSVRLPDSLEYGQVFVRVHYSGLCASQVHEIEALKGPDRYLPHLLGHEGSATVLEVGPGVSTVKPDDNVVMHWRPGSGIQSPNPRYQWDDFVVNAGSVTTLNSFAVVSENRLTQIPEWFDLRLAPLFGCAITTAFGAIGNDAGLKVGESIVVFGAGGVGLAAIHAAHMTSAYPIIAVDLVPDKLEVAKTLGATHVVNGADAQEVLDSVEELLGVDGADVVIETTGVSSVIGTAYQACGPQGRTVLVGVPDYRESVSLHTLPLHFGKVLTGSHGGSTIPQRDIPRLVRLVEAGKLNLALFPLTEHPLSEINVALEALKHGVAGRQLIKLP
jgi:S-(hydroxymethyl)glutathione dehydrogenase/alcohol dehydrogenase